MVFLNYFNKVVGRFFMEWGLRRGLPLRLAGKRHSFNFRYCWKQVKFLISKQWILSNESISSQCSIYITPENVFLGALERKHWLEMSWFNNILRGKPTKSKFNFPQVFPLFKKLRPIQLFSNDYQQNLNHDSSR